MSARSAADLYELSTPYVVLATGVLITACCTRNFAPIDLLKAPSFVTGTTDGRVAAALVPKWFPLDEAIFEAAGGAIYTKVKDFPLARNTQPSGDNATQAAFDVSSVALPAHVRTFTLCYFPWFRFLTEPINFDAVGKVALYIAGCFRFLLTREGFAASLTTHGDVCKVLTDTGVEIECHGMQSLRKLVVTHGEAQSSFDLDARQIRVDRRMFPDVFAAGHDMLKTEDRLINMDVTETEHHLILSEKRA
jgi:hypothetical protein